MKNGKGVIVYADGDVYDVFLFFIYYRVIGLMIKKKAME